MSNFATGPACGMLQAHVYQPDPRYQVRPEWTICADKIRRIRYRAYFGSCVIGEIMPSFHRDAVIADLQEIIDTGGVGEMTDLPGEEASGDV